MVKRDLYMKQIVPLIDNELIKVITGIRRCGKSYMLGLIKEELIKRGVKSHNIILINFDSKKYKNIINNNQLDNVVEKSVKNKKGKVYLFFDEIQNVEKWELVINSFKSDYKEKVSIFITGSNSDLLSGELATHIAGRYVSFKVLPFSFEEVCILKENIDKNKYELEIDFVDYMNWGGMPQRFIFENEAQIRTYLTDVYNSIVVKDIVERFKVKDIDLFNRILEYILTTPAQTFSAETLSKYFESENRNVTKNTLYNYLEYMNKALLINKVDRYDVRGKRILNGKYKYYLTDLGLGRVMNISKKEQIGAYIENIVYNELIYRGYDVKIGSLDNGEIDFIALKDGNKEYYQVCYMLSDENVINREFNAYNNIDDNYPKYVISMDKIDLSRNGIIHKNIIDWLLKK